MRRKLWLRLCGSAVLLVGADLAAGHWLREERQLFGRPIAPFDPPLFSSAQREALRKIDSQLESGSGQVGKFDAELGWCNRANSNLGMYRYDWAGARVAAEPLARERDPALRRVVAVGCSMTHGEEVEAKDAWCARVDAAADGLEIANLGVAAYGIDQALLRLRRDGWSLQPDEVWLGILPQAALRVTTHFRPLLDHWSSDVAFKPRFVFDGQGKLELLPNPAKDLSGARRLLQNQAEFLAAFGSRDPWVERVPWAYAPRGSILAHRSFLGRMALTILERTSRDHRRAFDEGQAFGRIYTEIVRLMARECLERRVTLRLVILPGKADLLERAQEGRGYWEDWSSARKAEGLLVLDTSMALTRGDEALDALFMPGGHYSAAGSRRVAQALLAELE